MNIPSKKVWQSTTLVLQGGRWAETKKYLTIQTPSRYEIQSHLDRMQSVLGRLAHPTQMTKLMALT